MTDQVPGIAGGRFESPAQDREVRAEEANIRQSGASAASSEANTATEEATRPYNVRKAAADAEKSEIDLAESRRALDQARRRGEFTQSLATPEATRVLSDIARARRLIQSGMGTGAAAFLSVNVPGSPASELWGQGGLRDSITSEGVMDALLSSREGSAQGATPFGQLAIREMELVRARQGSFAYGNSAEQNLRALDQMEQAYRRAFAFDMGLDWRTEEGARYAGVPYDPRLDPMRNPNGAANYDARLLGAGEAPFTYKIPPGMEGTETPPPSSGGSVERGEWVNNPELRGVDAAVTNLIKQGVASNNPPADIEADVRVYLNSVQPGLGDNANNIGDNIRYHQETGRDPAVTIERSYQSEGERPGAGTAYATGVADVLTGGFLDELTGKGAEMRAVEAENPTAYLIGQGTGGVLTSLLGGYGAARTGLTVPWYAQGAAANTIYGAGSADEDNRLTGAGIGFITTPFGNVAGETLGRTVGSVVGGTTDARARELAQRYGVYPTPGKVSPGGAMSWLESRLADFPLTQGAVTRRGDEAVQSFNEGTFNLALEPIGTNTRGSIEYRVNSAGQREPVFIPDPAGPTLTGRQGVIAANANIQQAYDDALRGVAIQVNPNAVFDDSWLQGVSGDTAASARRQIADMRSNLVDANGLMTGEQIQSAKRGMQELRNTLANDPAIERNLVNRVDNLQDELYNAFEAQAPDNFARYRVADQAFGNMQTVQNAVLTSPGALIDPEAGRTFLPSNLNTQARQGDIRYRGRRAAAEGEGTFAELSDFGETYIQPRGPSSRTAQIATTGAAFGLPAAAYMLAPSASSSGGEGEEGDAAPAGPSGLPAGLAYGLPVAAIAALPFTRGGSRLYGRMMTADRPDYARQLGKLFTRYGGPAIGSALARPAIDIFTSPVYPEPISFTDAGAPSPYRTNAGINIPPAAAPADPQAAPSTAQTGVVNINGRPARYDEATDRFLDVETGEPVDEGYKHGGRVKRRPVPTRALRG